MFKILSNFIYAIDNSQSLHLVLPDTFELFWTRAFNAAVINSYWRLGEAQSANFRTANIHVCILYFIVFLGVKLFIDAGLGNGPLHAMIIGIVDAVDLSLTKIGFVESEITIFFLPVWTLCNRRFPPLMAFVTMAAVGYLIDFGNMLDFSVIDWVPAAV